MAPCAGATASPPSPAPTTRSAEAAAAPTPPPPPPFASALGPRQAFFRRSVVDAAATAPHAAEPASPSACVARRLAAVSKWVTVADTMSRSLQHGRRLYSHVRVLPRAHSPASLPIPAHCTCMHCSGSIRRCRGIGLLCPGPSLALHVARETSHRAGHVLRGCGTCDSKCSRYILPHSSQPSSWLALACPRASMCMGPLTAPSQT